MSQPETAIVALAITVLVEWVVYAIALRRQPARLFLTSLLVNGLTEPVASVVVRGYSTWMMLLFVEIVVCVVEVALVAILLELSPRRATALSIAANGASALIGIILFWLN